MQLDVALGLLRQCLDDDMHHHDQLRRKVFLVLNEKLGEGYGDEKMYLSVVALSRSIEVFGTILRCVNV